MTGTLPSGLVHAFEIQGVAGDRIFIQAADTTNSYLTPTLKVYKPDGTLLCEADDNRVAEGLCLLTASGTHTVLFMDQGGPTAPYNVFIQRVSAPLAVTTVAYGSNTNSALAAGEVETFGFAGASGDRVYLRMGPHQVALIHPRFIVFRPDGTSLCSGSAAGLGSKSHVDCLLDATGDYTVITFEIMGSASGPYSMFVQDVADPVGATQLTYGTSYATS